ncbi:glycosyltransferase [Paenibacillus camerounensis]|uniref:glycosyltransferase n=1 Tax=Paenibacillus camerounensis TaxID=1243663 RepID=UPI0005A71F44|nr:glycosyltransferase [Paenibacillus camerounensis]
MTEPTIGVHLIIRNEAGLLPACLKSVAGADEIIVVDTGSEDDSIAVAEAYGARVLQYNWEDDFSRARNSGLRHAATGWILVLDADEILNTPLTKIRQILRGTTAEAFTVTIENILGHRTEERLYHTAVRLFRGGQDYWYSGKIHEGIDQAIISRHGISAIRHSSIQLVHTGYLPEIMSRKNKAERNEKLLRAAVAEQPENDFYSYNLAVACCQKGQLQEAEELLRHTLSRAPLPAPYRPAMIRDLGKIYLSAAKMSSIDALLAKELDRYSDYPDLHYLQGQSLEGQGLLERAFQSYERAAALAENLDYHTKYVSEHGITTFRPLHRMGEISRKLGRPDEAARLFHRSLQSLPLYAPALLGIVNSFQSLDVPDHSIAALLQQLVPADQPAGRAAIINALCAADAYEAVCGLPHGLVPPENGTLLQMIRAWIITGNPDTAMSLIREGRDLLGTEITFTGLLQELRVLEALCIWSQGSALQEEQLAGMPEEQHSSWYTLNQRLAGGAGASAKETAEGHADDTLDNTALAMLLMELIPLAVQLELYPLADSLAGLSVRHHAELAAALYKAGRVPEAGERFIKLAGDEQAVKPVAFYIGEMLYDKGHYQEAAGWFQQALGQYGQEDAARTGLAVCYLQLAAADLNKAVTGFGGDYEHGPILEDLAAIQNTLLLLNRTPWHTVWSRRKRQGGVQP